MLRVIVFILGIYLISVSISFIIIYLNLLSLGYSLMDYINFITRRYEVLSLFLGITLVVISLNKCIKNDKKEIIKTR